MSFLTLKEQRRALEKFFKAEVQNIEAATEAVIQANARALKRKTLREISKFKKGPQTNAGFFRAVKIYDLASNGTQGPASYVRLGVPFIGVFQEGDRIAGKPNLAILLPSGAAMGFRRVGTAIGHPESWTNVWERMKRVSDNGQVRIFKGPKGNLVAILKQGQWRGVYFMTRQVTVPKKLSVFETAEALSANMADEIVNILDQKNA
jgi:predicted RNA-binding protein YlxR (DUF448 family)